MVLELGRSATIEELWKALPSLEPIEFSKTGSVWKPSATGSPIEWICAFEEDYYLKAELVETMLLWPSLMKNET